MTLEIMSLGWNVRFAPVDLMDQMSDYYSQNIGLPRIDKMRIEDGDRENKDLFWGGEAIIVNHNFGGVGPPAAAREAHPDTARYCAIFRVSNLDEVVDRLRRRGATVLAPRACAHGREAFIVDPMGMLTGLRERREDSPLAEDREAARRRRRGEAFNPGCRPLPPDWQELGWIRMTAEDLPRLGEFYRDVVGLRRLGEADDSIRFDLGDNTILELAPGGVRRPAPPVQMAAQAAPILRTPDLDAALASLRARGVHFVHDVLTSPKSRFTYFADPEGNVIGICENLHPGDYVETARALPEDMEAQRRWCEAKAAGIGQGRDAHL
jgi:predicted enzyme related to lactoylglutathione lyase